MIPLVIGAVAAGIASVVPLGLVWHSFALHFSLGSFEEFFLLLLVVLVFLLLFLSELLFPLLALLFAAIAAGESVKLLGVGDLEAVVSSFAFQGDFVTK